MNKNRQKSVSEDHKQIISEIGLSGQAWKNQKVSWWKINQSPSKMKLKMVKNIFKKING